MAGLVPNSWGSLREYNDCHNPAGSPEGGRFCSTGRAAEEHSPWSRRENELWAKRRLLPELERARKTGNATHVKVLTRRLKVLGLTHLDRRARESNDCHLPAGSPEGGQFCGTDSPTPSSKKMEGSMVRLNGSVSGSPSLMLRQGLSMGSLLIPDSWGSKDLKEYNDCHNPAGSPEGGQFCSDPTSAEGGIDSSRFWSTKGERVLPDGRTVHEYHIPEANISRLVERIEGLAKRARKLNLPPPVLNLGEKFTEKRERPGRDPEVHVYQKVEVTVEPVKIPGWTLAAVLDHLPGQDENIIRTAPGFRTEDIPEKWRKTPGFCEHCRTQRQRNSTYLLAPDGGGDLKQCGSDCLIDYLGHDAERVAANATFMIGLNDALRGIPDEFDDRAVYNPYIDLPSYMAWVAAAARVQGRYISRKQADEWADRGIAPVPTADEAEHLRYMVSIGKDPTLLVGGQKVVVRPTDEDRALAQDVLAWTRDLEKSGKLNDFQWNLVAATRTDALHQRYRRIAAAAFPSYLRAKQITMERDRAKKESNYLGKIGERTVFKDLRLTHTYGYEGDYGIRTLHRFVDPVGNIVVWWKSGERDEDSKVGDIFDVKATVAKHETYKDVKQTGVKRAVLTKRKVAA